MRRVVFFFVVALLGAGYYGLSGASSGVSVDHVGVSGNAFRSELAAIATHNTLQCFIVALDPTDYSLGAGGNTIKATGAQAWANLRVEGLAIDHYVTTRLKYRPNHAELAAAKASLESEMTQQASSHSLACPGTSSKALGEMPPEMRAAQIEAQATSLYLVQRLTKAIPLTSASIKSYYDAHKSAYDTLCVSIALVVPSSVKAFARAQASGASVAQLAREFSQDPSRQRGGAYQCYSPAESAYGSVRADVAARPLDTFPSTPQYINFNSSLYALYVAVTKRTATPLSSAAPTVLSDLQQLNASSASSVKNELLYVAAVHIDPSLGRWGLGPSGPSVFALASPRASAVPGRAQLSATGGAVYK